MEGARFSETSFLRLSANSGLRLFYQFWQISPDPVGDAHDQFQGRIAQTALDLAKHGLGDAGSLRDGVVGQVAPQAFLAQESNDLRAKRMVVLRFRHGVENSWKNELPVTVL